jgi:hypothetical protein
VVEDETGPGVGLGYSGVDVAATTVIPSFSDTLYYLLYLFPSKQGQAGQAKPSEGTIEGLYLILLQWRRIWYTSVCWSRISLSLLTQRLARGVK